MDQYEVKSILSESKFLTKHKLSGKQFQIRTIARDSDPVDFDAFMKNYRTANIAASSKREVTDFFETEDNVMSIFEYDRLTLRDVISEVFPDGRVSA